MIVDKVSAQNTFLSRFDRPATFLYTRWDEFNKRLGGQSWFFSRYWCCFNFTHDSRTWFTLSYNLLLTKSFITLNITLPRDSREPPIQY